MNHEGAHGSDNIVTDACLLETHAEDEGAGNFPSLTCNFPTPTEISKFDENVTKIIFMANILKKINHNHLKIKLAIRN